MAIYLLQTFTPIAALVINVLSQIISVHCTRRISFSIIFGFICGLFFLLCLTGSLIFSERGLIILFTYLTLSFCFWAFLNLNITSLRIRIVRELLKSENPDVSRENLFQLYSPQELISRRIQRLEKMGHIKKKNDKWVLQSKKILFLTVVTNILRKMIIPARVQK